MLTKLFVLLWAVYAVRLEDAGEKDLLNILESETELQRLVPGYFNQNIDSKVRLGTKSERMVSNICPASEILIQIQEILTKLLNEDNEILKESSNLNEVNTQNDNALVNNGQPPENYDEHESLIIPIIKNNAVQQLLQNNNVGGKLKTKLTVQYELPSIEDVNCKQALSKILQILKKANLYGNNNILHSTINHENNNAPNTLFNMLNNQKSHKSTQDIDIESQASKEVSDQIMSIPKDYGETEQLNDVSEGAKSKLDRIANIAHLINSNSHSENDLAFKLTEWYKTITNDGEIVSSHSSKSNVFNNTEGNALNEQKTVDMNELLNNFPMDDNAKVQNQHNIPSSAENLLNIYLQDNSENVASSNITNVLSKLNLGNNKNNILAYLLQSKFQNNQPLQQLLMAAQNMKYPYLQAYNINPNLNPLNQNTYHYPSEDSTNYVYQIPYNTGNNKYYVNNGNTEPAYGNVDFVYQNPNHANNVPNGNPEYQTSYNNANPFPVSKLIDYRNHVNQQLHASNNFANLQRMVGMSNFVKLNSAPDNSGIVELTYVLKQHNPVVYQPTYYVKYRLPYESFIYNFRDLLQRKPHLRSEPAKLYHELLNASNIAEVSPNLRGVGKQELLNLVTNNGALVKTEVMKVDEALLDKQLRTIQNLNSKLTPTEIVNNSYAMEPTRSLDIRSDYKKINTKIIHGSYKNKPDKNNNWISHYSH